MPQYKRFLIDGGIYFFTVVTYKHLPILMTDTARRLLHQAWMDTQRRFPFETIAICLLPDHVHFIWQLPEGDANYSIRWREIKRRFTRGYLREIGPGEPRNGSHQKHHEAAIWQRRFWEHTILDEEDFENHLDYIHYNPIKHGYVTRSADWEWSSFRRYVNDGIYDLDWVGGDAGRIQRFNFE
ncbi:MAG: transposase [Anaerolineaceae bacterium]